MRCHHHLDVLENVDSMYFATSSSEREGNYLHNELLIQRNVCQSDWLHATDVTRLQGKLFRGNICWIVFIKNTVRCTSLVLSLYICNHQHERHHQELTDSRKVLFKLSDQIINLVIMPDYLDLEWTRLIDLSSYEAIMLIVLKTSETFVSLSLSRQ